jgi:hypothetical protein
MSLVVSEKHDSACHLLSCGFLAQLIFSTLKMEAICSSEKSVDTQRTTRQYIPEDGTLHNHRCENLKPYEHLVFQQVGALDRIGGGQHATNGNTWEFVNSTIMKKWKWLLVNGC